MPETVTTLVEENKRQKVFLDDVQAKLKREWTKRKKQSKKVSKLAKATKEMYTQMSKWFSFLKSTHPDIPVSNVVLPLLSENEDHLEGGSEDNNNMMTTYVTMCLRVQLGCLNLYLFSALYVFGILASSLLCSHLLLYFGNTINS